MLGGYPGGDTVKTNNNFAAGGGGGAGGPGVSGVLNSDKGGNGGPGVNYDITGELLMYGAGGGGTVFYSPDKGYGRGGAGDGYGDSYRSDTITGQPGHDGFGSGGGGGKANGGALDSGGRGGCGTVIIRFTIDASKDSFSANITRSIKVPTTVTFTAELGTDLSDMTWDFGDGSDPVVTTDLTVSHEYTAAGVYTVTMQHGAQTITKTGYIEIISGTLYVDDDSENPEYPYDSPSKAAKYIEDALAIAENGFMICIAPGDYPLKSAGNALQVTNAVTMIGTGASSIDVVIRNPQTRRGYAKDQVLYVNNADAMVANVTIADAYIGNAGWGASIYIDAYGGTVSNCVIRDGSANIPVQAKCGGVYMKAGLLTHSVISNCFFMAQSGDLNNTELANALLINGSGRAENCLIQDCGVGVGAVVSLQNANAELVNCTIVGGEVGFWTGNNRAITNLSYAVGCQNGAVKNVAVYNVKRVAFNDEPETYEAAFGTDLSKFTCCVKAEKGDFVDYDSGNLSPSSGGALFDAGEDSAVNEATDLAGNTRIVGAHVDVGCYEATKPVGLRILLR